MSVAYQEAKWLEVGFEVYTRVHLMVEKNHLISLTCYSVRQFFLAPTES